MRNRLIAFAVLFALFFVPILLLAHPARFVDGLFIARSRRRFEDRPGNYDYPDA